LWSSRAPQTRIGVPLPSTLVFDHPTQDALITYVDGLLAPVGPATAAFTDSAPATATPLDAHVPRALALLPGSGHGAVPTITISATVSRVPAAVSAGGDAVRSVPWGRWDAERRLTDDLPARFGAWLPRVHELDAAALGLSDREAAMTDSQQRCAGWHRINVHTLAAAVCCAVSSCTLAQFRYQPSPRRG
jgi:hypothetical protein